MKEWIVRMVKKPTSLLSHIFKSLNEKAHRNKIILNLNINFFFTLTEIEM
jgi:hypothetical protein